ncbi:MAG: hypothetical protein ACK4NW_08185, partial [Roseinatronobacter sp.]
MKAALVSILSGIMLCCPGLSPSKAQLIDDTPLVVFSMDDGKHGRELWVTDGTEEGTRMIFDIRSGPIGSGPSQFVATEDGRAFFTASAGTRRLWITDGTRGGTHPVTSQPSGAGSVPTNLTYVGNGRVAYSAQTEAHGREPWISDGTEQGTFRLVNANPGPASSDPYEFRRLDDRVFMFSATRNGQQRIWISDGTTAGTEMIPGPLRDGYEFTMLDETRVLFAAEHPVRGGQPWIFDLTTRTRPSLLRNLNSDGSWPYRFTRMGDGSVIFAADHPNRAYEPYVTDGTRAGTSLLRALTSGGEDTNPTNFTPLNAAATQLVFSTRLNPSANGADSVWVTDGTRNGTTRLQNNLSVPGFPNSTWIARLDNRRALIAATNTRNANSEGRGRTLWVTDGTSGGTTEIFRPNGGQENFVSELTPLGGGIALFTGYHRNSGFQVYRTDGTEAG